MKKVKVLSETLLGIRVVVADLVANPPKPYQLALELGV